MAELRLTPAEALAVEVLAARWRLGEQLWTFDSNQRKWLNSLMEKGLVTVMHGIVENTIRASFTEEGLKYYWPKGAPECGQAGEPKSETLTPVEQAILSALVQLKLADTAKLSSFLLEVPSVINSAVLKLLSRGLIERDSRSVDMFKIAK